MYTQNIYVHAIHGVWSYHICKKACKSSVLDGYDHPFASKAGARTDHRHKAENFPLKLASHWLRAFVIAPMLIDSFSMPWWLWERLGAVICGFAARPQSGTSVVPQMIVQNCHIRANAPLQFWVVQMLDEGRTSQVIQRNCSHMLATNAWMQVVSLQWCACLLQIITSLDLER